MNEDLTSAPQTTASDDLAGATSERLLDAAESLFARKGYAATSVRDITSHANSNLAAVNYHFGSKHNLYREVLLRRLRAIRQQRLNALEEVTLGDKTASNLAQTLRSFAEAFLAPLRDLKPEQRPMRLLMREVVDPRLPRDLFETELVLPVQLALTRAIGGAAPLLDETTVNLCAQSFLAQLLHVLHAHQFAPQGDESGIDPLQRTALVDHIVRFTTAAIDRLQVTGVKVLF